MDEHIDEITEDEDLDTLEEESDDEEGTPEPEAKPGEEGEVESSLEELLAKREPRPAEEEEEDESLLSVTRDERLEPLAVKVIPPTDKEFVCTNCHLVKHRSQLANRERMLCRDCA